MPIQNFPLLIRVIIVIHSYLYYKESSSYEGLYVYINDAFTRVRVSKLEVIVHPLQSPIISLHLLILELPHILVFHFHNLQYILLYQWCKILGNQLSQNKNKNKHQLSDSLKMGVVQELLFHFFNTFFYCFPLSL